MNLAETLKINRDKILEVSAKYGAKNIRIFGSVARGDFDRNSDIDFLVDMEKGRSLFDMGGLLMELQKMLGCKVDVVTSKGLRSRIKEKVIKNSIYL